MMIFIVFSTLAGMFLAQRFKVLALLPAILAAGLLAIAWGIHAGSGWFTALLALAAGAAIQIGYLLGLGIHHLPAIFRPGRNSPSIPSSTAAGRGAH